MVCSLDAQALRRIAPNRSIATDGPSRVSRRKSRLKPKAQPSAERGDYMSVPQPAAAVRRCRTKTMPDPESGLYGRSTRCSRRRVVNLHCQCPLQGTSQHVPNCTSFTVRDFSRDRSISSPGLCAKNTYIVCQEDHEHSTMHYHAIKKTRPRTCSFLGATHL